MTLDSQCLLCAVFFPARISCADLKYMKIKKSGLATTLSNRAKPIPKIVGITVRDIGYTLETEVFGARKEFAYILRTYPRRAARSALLRPLSCI